MYQTCLPFCILDIEVVKKEVPKLKLEKESSNTPTMESPKTPTNESICTPTKNTIEIERVKKLKEPLDDSTAHMKSPLVQNIRGNETDEVANQENKEKINNDQNINNKSHDTIDCETGLELNKSKDNQNVDVSPIKEKNFENNNDNATSQTATTATKNPLVTPEHEFSETASASSWMSIDDDIKVKKIKGEQTIKNGTETTPPVSGQYF